ncbi:VOC family protein [Roseiterribacter gracilis]|uniref:Glyoxalase n=1 Tax=Roseiterribacter gracilis TaxID=2812848 RepID=A0A8S8XEQ6_9PROT|nr:glyoxalase [Rhodospirillales bacterium TMPK1]
MSANSATAACEQPPATGQQPMPKVRSGITAYLCVSNAAKAAAFYERAFGGKILLQIPPDEKGRTMHIHLEINGASLMLSDGFPEHGHPVKPHQGYTLHLQVDDIDKRFQHAIDAGGEIVLPVQDMFWGDRYGQLRDPFGVMWSMGMTPTR